MSISFECPTCGKHLKAPDAAAGKSSKCPGCGGKVTCPAPVEGCRRRPQGGGRQAAEASGRRSFREP